MSSPAGPSKKQEINRLILEAEQCLTEAQVNFAARRGRKVMEIAFLACYHAASALWLASGLYAGEGGGPGPGETRAFGPGGKSLAAFYHQFANVKRRLDNDSKTYVNIEEVANWLRMAGWFVSRVSLLAKKHAA